MASLYQTIRSQLDQVAAVIQQVEAAGPKVTYSIGGKSVDWTAYLDSKYRQQRELMGQLQLANLIDQGPWESRSYGM